MTPFPDRRSAAAPLGRRADRYRLRIKRVPMRWLPEISNWRPPRSFTDVQREAVPRDEGNFIDEWPNGFFDERLTELFGDR